MRLERTLLVSALVATALGIYPAANAQNLPDPARRDQVTVNLPHRVTVGDRTLEPGDYRIRQVTENRVSITRNPSGSSAGSQADAVEAAVTQIITAFNDPAEQTEVILHRFGNDYYFDKVWLEGKGYGYLFTLPDATRGRERERGESPILPGRYEQVPRGAQ